MNRLLVPCVGLLLVLSPALLCANEQEGIVVGIHTNRLLADVSSPFAAGNYPYSVAPQQHAWVHISSGEGYAHAHEEFRYEFRLRVGDRLRVTSVVGADEIAVENADGEPHLAATEVQSYTGSNRWRTLNGSATEAIAVRFYLPNGTRLRIPGHGLREGDVLRITQVTETLQARFLGGGFRLAERGRRIYGAETYQVNAPPAVRTWQSGRGIQAVDGFFVAGMGWRGVDKWVDEQGPESTASHEISGRFAYEVVGAR